MTSPHANKRVEIYLPGEIVACDDDEPPAGPRPGGVVQCVAIVAAMILLAVIAVGAGRF